MGCEKEGGLERVLAYLTGVRAWYLATAEAVAGEEGIEAQPHVRPFSFAEIEDGRLWFATATTKDVYRELAANPRFEISCWKPGSGWVIMRGRAVFGEPSAALREHGCAHLEMLGERYAGSDDERLAFFFIDRAEAWICDIDGSWEPVEL